MTPNTHMVTEAPHIAVLRPNLSETKPEQNEPRANPVKYKEEIILSDFPFTLPDLNWQTCSVSFINYIKHAVSAIHSL